MGRRESRFAFFRRLTSGALDDLDGALCRDVLIVVREHRQAAMVDIGAVAKSRDVV